MTTEKLKGKGGLGDCPKCHSQDITSYDEDYVDHKNSIKRIQCNNCGSLFTESWKAIDWEES